MPDQDYDVYFSIQLNAFIYTLLFSLHFSYNVNAAVAEMCKQKAGRR